MARRPSPPWFGWVADGAPALAFLAGYLSTRDFQFATWCVIVASVLAFVAALIVERRIRPLPAVTGGLAIAFGLASVLLHDKNIFKMKMTIVDGALGAALFIGLLMGKNPLKAILGGAFQLPDAAWKTLAVRYGLFWWACAAANEYVRRTQSDHVFVLFRTGVWVAAIVFALAQTPFFMKHGALKSAAPAIDPPDGGV
jgi:intracellular septation protein